MNTRIKLTLTHLVALAAFAGAPANNPVSATAASGISHGQAEGILQELRQIRKLLSAGPAAAAPSQGAQQPPAPSARARVKVDANAVLGSRNAPITIVEFTDAQCGFCRQFHANAFADIRRKLIDTGKVRFVSRDLPLDAASISMRAAEAMRCAGEQGHFWQLREAIMTSTGRLTDEKLDEHAKAAGIAVPAMRACIVSRKYVAGIQKDMDEAASLGVAGTPTFIIGRTTAEGVDGVTLVGALGFEAFEAKIREVEKR